MTEWDAPHGLSDGQLLGVAFGCLAILAGILAVVYVVGVR